MISTGYSAKELLSCQLRWEGPEWMMQEQWPAEKPEAIIPHTVHELNSDLVSLVRRGQHEELQSEFQGLIKNGHLSKKGRLLSHFTYTVY